MHMINILTKTLIHHISQLQSLNDYGGWNVGPDYVGNINRDTRIFEKLLL